MCGALGGDRMCCNECQKSQALAAKRAAPFDSADIAEVRCPLGDETTKRPPANICTVNADGRFACGASCSVQPAVTYEDL